jgi:5'-3' exonuclease
MGIPSYYKKLIDTVPGLVLKSHPGTVNWLFMDFNCLIYHCLYREDTPAYYGSDRKDEWEKDFLDCVVKYCLKVIKEVAPRDGVYIAIDGVVPMAKMRQQRLRRFKSSWVAAEGKTDGEEKWDRNAITPGTNFMNELTTKLREMIDKHGKKSWTLNSSNEPGEGEHKIIKEWRNGGTKYSGNFAIYGLDADLIVLSILGQELCGFNNNIWLFREEVVGGKITYTDEGEEVFEWFSIDSLRDWLVGQLTGEKRRNFILSYCFSMSVLGNDFLPSALSLKIRDDGHEELLEIIRGLTTGLIDTDSLEISLFGLSMLFSTLSGVEEDRLLKYLNKKLYLSWTMTKADTPETGVGENNWPLSTVEESFLVENRKLVTNWQTKYLTGFFGEMQYNQKNIGKICKEYLYGIQWIWAYYTGDWNNVCFNWFYPYNLPPLWSWLYTHLTENDGLCEFPGDIKIRVTDIKPVEQLSLVLPIESWSLLPIGSAECEFPYMAPQYFPSKFGFESVGKRYFWECESLIPLPTILELKQIISWRKESLSPHN